MATGNWDHFALNERGERCSSFKTPSGVVALIYKNFLYVEDEDRWVDENGGFVRPVVMTVAHGKIVYRDLCVEAFRGPQDGLYVVAHSVPHNTTGGMVGCGVAGYDDEDRWVGVQVSSVSWLREKIRTSGIVLAVDKLRDVVEKDELWSVGVSTG